MLNRVPVAADQFAHRLPRRRCQRQHQSRKRAMPPRPHRKVRSLRPSRPEKPSLDRQTMAACPIALERARPISVHHYHEGTLAVTSIDNLRHPRRTCARAAGLPLEAATRPGNQSSSTLATMILHLAPSVHRRLHPENRSHARFPTIQIGSRGPGHPRPPTSIRTPLHIRPLAVGCRAPAWCLTQTSAEPRQISPLQLPAEALSACPSRNLA